MATKDITDAQVVQAVIDSKASGREWWPYDLIMQQTGECFKVCYAAMERSSGRDLIECGVSLRTAWVTPKGRELIDA
jgi:hypothetical protein